MTVVLIVMIVVLPLLLIALGALAILKLQRRVIEHVSNTALEQRLLRDGVVSTAQVLDAADTGKRIDAVYLLTRLDLQVAAAEGVRGFAAQIVVPLSAVRVAQIVPGSTVKVRVDPSSHEVVLDQPRI